jgi:hypothetical protein
LYGSSIGAAPVRPRDELDQWSSIMQFSQRIAPCLTFDEAVPQMGKLDIGALERARQSR